MLEPDRLLSPKTSAEDRYDRALRPKSLNDYIGQKTVKDQMGIFMEAAKRRTIRSYSHFWSSRSGQDNSSSHHFK